MKTGLKYFAAVAALALAGNAFAASITVPTLAIQKGTSMDLNIAFTGDASTTNLDITMNYDETVVDESTLAAVCVKPPELTSWSCSVDTANNQIKAIGSQFGAAAVSSTDPIVVVTLPILLGAASGDSVNTFTANFFDVGGGDTGSQVDVDWTVTVTDGPQPAFAATPDSVTQSGQISTTIDTDVVIDNNGGDDGSTLNYSCAETADPDNKFSYSGDLTNIDVAKGATATATVTCDSSAVGGPFTGTMQCTHNGLNASPVDVALSCNVTAGPEPAFTGVASGLTMNAAEEGDADPTGSLTITNTGDASTTLTGTCSLTGPDAEISLTGGAFSVAQATAGAVMGVACDASAEGTYNSTLSCTHNGTNVASPATYPVSCTVGPPGPAVYQSTPAPGETIEFTPTDVPVDATVPDQVLTITNAAPEANDRPLEVSGCAYVGDPAITVGAAPSSPIAPMASSTATFSCDTAVIGDYNGTYTCSFAEEGGAGPVGQATYPVHCGVRAAESNLDSTPPAGSTLNIVVPINGNGSVAINVSETLDEGVDASIDSCTLADGASFTIITTFPLVVPAGGTVQIEIQGTDPADGSLTVADALTCVVTDSSGTSDAVWDLNLTVQTAVIPTLSTWGLLAMFLTMLSLGGIVIRRKARS